MAVKSNISQVVCGIMFSDTFKLFDKWGEIADKILYSPTSKKIFGDNYYNRIGDNIGYQRVLTNSETNNNLRLTQSNLVVTHNVYNNDFDSAYQLLRNIMIKYIFPEIISPNILMVRRIGVVFSCPMEEESITIYKKTIINSDSCNLITDFRFSKKEPTPQGLVQKGTENYVNKIISVGHLADSVHGISYDYQYFFLPPNAEAERRLTDIFDQSLKSLCSDIFEKIEVKK